MNNLAKDKSPYQNTELLLDERSPITKVDSYPITDTMNIDNHDKSFTKSVVQGEIAANDIDNLIETGNKSMLDTPNQNDYLDHSSRKPYLHTQPANWYQHNNFFKCYMLRELTAIPVALEAFNLFWGLYSLASSASHWQQWVNVQANFLVVILHLLVIIAAVYNSYTWFAAMPKAVRIQIGEKFVSDKVLIGGSWLTLIIILIALVAIVTYFCQR